MWMTASLFFCWVTRAGKSTLLKLILREETPTEGRVLVNGQDVAACAAARSPTCAVRWASSFRISGSSPP